ncbi:MAG: hypothetical protein ACM37W_00685 [Actinomycetota bacterium]
MKNNKQFRISSWLISSILLALGICTTFSTTSLGNPSDRKKAEQVSSTRFPLGFSVDKMDTTVDPRQDFYRFAAGKWLDAVEPTPEFLRVSDADFLGKEVSKQLEQILSQAASQSTHATKGRVNAS